MNAIDTNVLIYAKDPRDPDKQAKALELIQNLEDGVLLWQVACEFLANSHKLVPYGLSRDEACRELGQLHGLWRTVTPGWQVLDRTNQLIATFSLSFWDALLISACLEAGVNVLYSEDLTAYPRIESLEIVNPFVR